MSRSSSRSTSTIRHIGVKSSSYWSAQNFVSINGSGSSLLSPRGQTLMVVVVLRTLVTGGTAEYHATITVPSSSGVNMPVGFATYLALKDTVHYVEYGEHHIPCTSKPAYSGCFFNLHMCDDVIGIAHV